MTRTHTIFICGVSAIIAVIIAASLSLNALLVDSAKSYLKTLGDNTISLHDTRIPCMGYFDVGYIVDYQRPRATVPSRGRICRPIMSPDWAFYPDPNEANR